MASNNGVVVGKKRKTNTSNTITSPSLSFLPNSFKQSVANQTQVSLSIAKQLLLDKHNADKNLVFSPVSIQLLLSLITAGSSGETRDQLLSFLQFETAHDLNTFCSHVVDRILPTEVLSLGYGVWIDKSISIKKAFKQVVDNLYKAATQQVDFQNEAAQAIALVNSWVEKETRGLIKQILSPGSFDRFTRLVLANALYFKGTWTNKFITIIKHLTFQLLDGSSTMVPFMTNNDEQFVGVFNGFKVLRLLYKQGKDMERQFSMYLVLPHENNGLTLLKDKICSEPGFLERHIPYKRIKLAKFLVPKFKMDFSFSAIEMLKALGLDLPFSPGGLTDKAESPDGEELYVSQILRRSVIEVSVEGTTAATVSVATPKFAGRPTPFKEIEPIVFVADHPFVFLIREDTSGVVQFMGQVLYPLAKPS